MVISTLQKVLCDQGRTSQNSYSNTLVKNKYIKHAPCPASYIGQSGRRLEQRIKQHKRAVINADFNSSALAEHAWKSGHPVDWANVKVIDVAPDLHSRVIREVFAIQFTNNVVNRDGRALPREYEGLVDVSSSTGW